MNRNYYKIGVIATAISLAALSVDGAAAPRKRKVAAQKTSVASAQAPAQATSTATATTTPQDQKNADSFKQVMTLEREFAPIVQDANKLDRQPAIEPPIITRSVVSYADWYAQTAIDNHISNLPAGQVFEEQPFDKKIGYIDANFGNYLATNVDAGINIIQSSNTLLKAFGGFHFTKGDIEMNHQKSVLKDWESKYSSGHGTLLFNHAFNTFEMNAEVGYQGRKYNLMNHYVTPNNCENGIDPIKQENKDFNLQIGFNNINRGLYTQYEAEARIQSFTLLHPDMQEFETQLKGHVMFPINDRNGGIKVSMDAFNYSYKNKDTQVNPYYLSLQEIENSIHFSASPYILFDFDALEMNIGVRADLITGSKPHFGFAPNIHINYNLDDYKQSLYLDIDGGLDKESLRALSYRMPFYIPMSDVNNPWTAADLTFGYKNAVNGNYRGQIFAGLKYTADELTAYGTTDTEGLGTYTKLTNYDNLTLKAGVSGDYTYNKFFSLEGQAVYYYRQEEKCNSQQPKFVLDVHAYTRPTKELLIDLSFAGKFGRDAWFNDEIKEDLKNVADLGVKVSYSFPYNLTFEGSINNILCQKYDVWYGVPAQGINFHVGGVWRF